MSLASNISLPAPSGTWPALLVGLAGTALAALALAALTPLDSAFTGAALGAYLAVAAVVAGTIGRNHPAPGFGLPNLVTLVRVIATSLVIGYMVDVLAGFRPPDGLALGFALLSAASILADGVDGWLARTRGPSTPFGARFDMEIDALLLLALSVLAYGLGKAGAWVIAIGAIRYAFVAASLALPWLAGPLPPSFRRKAVCVVQGAALTLLASPFVEGAAATVLAAAALAALAWSFAVDIVFLAANRRRPASA